MSSEFRDPEWPHAPVHKLSEAGTYMVTCGTYNKLHHFRGAHRLGVLHRGLLAVAREFEWQLEAWAVFSNHYHFVGHSPADGADSLGEMLGKLHGKTAIWLNKVDRIAGRKVWFNYYDTELTSQRSYLARLNYVHNNAVKHGLVQRASRYPWCSAGWFERTVPLAQLKLIYSFKTDKLNIHDDFEPHSEW